MSQTSPETETDIVERLRRASIPFWYHERPRLVQEAADEIERLRGLAQTPAVTVTDDELFNLAAAAWETQTSHPWYTDALEAAVYAVRERLTVSDTSTDRPDTRPLRPQGE